MARPMFTQEELEELRLFAEELDEEFVQTQEEIEASRKRDRKAKLSNMAPEKRKIAERKAAYREANKDKIAEYQAAYREKNRGAYNAYMREYLRKRRAERKAEKEADDCLMTGGSPLGCALRDDLV